jgi:hypothetical protein
VFASPQFQRQPFPISTASPRRYPFFSSHRRRFQPLSHAAVVFDLSSLLPSLLVASFNPVAFSLLLFFLLPAAHPSAMDLGLYNKRSEPRGEHGTLIGNWVEERALKSLTGHTRYEDLTLEKKALNQTQARIVAHKDANNRDVDALERISTSAATYVAHSNDHFTPKIFNQTGSHWHHDQGPAVSFPAAGGRTPQRRDQQSHISFGNDQSPFASTQASSFLHPTTLVPSVREPLALQQTTKFVPRPFPDNHVRSGAAVISKLDRPYATEE